MNIQTGRSEAFSDGVIAIIITIMVFDLKLPASVHDATAHDIHKALAHLWPRLIAYASSFLIVGIMWLNHHHMFHLLRVVDEKVAWLNLHFLFWLSLIPFPTSMLGANPLLPESAALYGAALFMTALAFMLLRVYIFRKGLMHQDDRSIDRKIDRINRRSLVKNTVGLLCYAASVPVAFYSVYVSFGLFLVQPVLFFIPDGVPEAGEDLPGEG